jgi:hypothetical protein
MYENPDAGTKGYQVINKTDDSHHHCPKNDQGLLKTKHQKPYQNSCRKNDTSTSDCSRVVGTALVGIVKNSVTPCQPKISRQQEGHQDCGD